MHRERVTVQTDERLTTVDVTAEVRNAIPDGVDGLCTVSVQHTTAGVVLQEAERGLRNDIVSFLADLVSDGGWEHDRVDDNADSHLRATLLGASETIPVEDGELSLGTWQSVLFVECDGPRSRSVVVTVLEG
ncbi:secondary thiamine-phosphate synthase enzyme YjbQ [Haloarchaeobius sp. TZWWS8]|uniref:secondary thiamine-phosphate synthase enzyme YjbQ n=1 Tax=Haloarchaeobius sp. TZWWS8 TaxID=3446121 RepID=UPI003EC0F384